MAKLTLNIAKEIARSRGGECISESYINCQMPMFWKCAKDHLWSARLSSVKNENTWRPRSMKKFAEKKGGFCLTAEYVNRRDPLKWQCKEGHKWKASAKDILKGTWCRRCSILGRKHVIPDKKPIPVQRHDHVTHQSIDIANSIAQERGGHKWFASFNSIKHVKSWCPYCLNKHENLCREVITNILGPPSSVRRPDFLKIPEHPRGLELDIYYPQYGFAIEVQGKQHEQHVKYFHKDPEEFEKQLMRDQLKKELCEKNSIVLRYVWYYEDPYKVIPNHLRELGLIE
ncbi:hypothetical protein RhiirA1_443673 [Rhizophagus irregularis]|uniref:Zinc-ribbon domain-containing protein n=3 Tax=Rhizophagus irregularis TaxID=588596 RepID=A0A2N0RHX6_9GLOM|nr:hypothetical protein RhiirA1_443673 [Rhizophagus irregularis]